MTEILLYLLGILIVLVGLAISIGLHEVGHLLPAKLFGVKVTQYMIGFGPTLWSRRKGETEYGVKAIPLGGYIAMTGMYPPAKPGGRARDASTGFFDSMVQDGRDASAGTIEEGEDHRTFYRLPMWKKIIVMFGGPFMNLLLAFVFFGIVLVGFGVPQASTTLGAVSECLVPASSDQTECGEDDPAAPAAAAGLLPGDRVVSVGGTAVDSWEQFRDTVAASPGRALDVVVLRDGAEQRFSLTPVPNERALVDEQGAVVTDAGGDIVTETVGMIGATPASEVVRQPVSEVPAYVGDTVVRIGDVILNLPQRMVDVWNAAFGTAERDPNGPISVVGIGRFAGEVVSLDEAPVADRAQVLIGLLGSLNVALFVFNLVPLMPLDGGHIAGAIYEGIKRGIARLRGKPDPGPIDTAKMIPVTFAVVVVLGAMSVLLMYADIVKPVSLFG